MKRLSIPMLVSIAAHAALVIVLSGVVKHWLRTEEDRPLSGSGGGGVVTVEIVGDGGLAGAAAEVSAPPAAKDAEMKVPRRSIEKRSKGGGAPSAAMVGPGTGPGGPGAGSGPSGGGNAVLAEIRARIERAKRYPVLLRQSGVQGVAHVGFRINGDGLPEAVTLKISSGSSALDQEALATIRRAAPYPVYPDTLNIGIRFELKD